MNAKHSESWWSLAPTTFDIILSDGYGVTRLELVVIERYLLLFKIKINPSCPGF